MKYPIGIQSFDRIREDGYVYVDKTALIYELVSKGTIYFLSRPRRFGKSLLISTLENYFLGRKELFRGLAIDSLEKEWKEYPVFHLDFNGKNFTSPMELKETIEIFIAKCEEKYGKDELANTYGDRLAYVFEKAHEKTGRRVVVLIDEYDKPLLDVMNTDTPSPVVAGDIKTLEDYNREILKGFYSIFKLTDKHLQFVLAHGSHQVLSGQRVQRFQPACRHKLRLPFRHTLRHLRKRTAFGVQGSDTGTWQSERHDRGRDNRKAETEI